MKSASGSDEPPATKETGTDAAATANMAWNAARLQTGMTEVLVAPGLRTPQDQGKLDSPLGSSTEQASMGNNEGQETEEGLGDDTRSQALQLHLDPDSEAGAAAGNLDLPMASEAEKEQATRVMGLVGSACSPEEEQGIAKEEDVGANEADVNVREVLEDVGAQEADLDVQSMLSDGADSYQGLPAETLAHLAASANDSMSDAGEEAEKEGTIAAQSNFLDAACEEGLEVQEALQEAPEPGTAVQTEPHAEEEQETSIPEKQLQQLDDAVTECPQGEGQAHMDVDSFPEAAGASPNSPVQAQTGAGAARWEKGTEVEVYCSTAPQLWSWRVGTLGDAHLPEGSSPAIVQWRGDPAATSCLSELVESARLRPFFELYISDMRTLARGTVLEVGGDDGSFKCAVLVSRQSPSLGEQRDLHSIVQGLHARTAGTVVLHALLPHVAGALLIWPCPCVFLHIGLEAYVMSVTAYATLVAIDTACAPVFLPCISASLHLHSRNLQFCGSPPLQQLNRAIISKQLYVCCGTLPALL